jgi:hypothetical protein
MSKVLIKSKVKSHQRRSKTGKVSQVKEHTDSRTKKVPSRHPKQFSTQSGVGSSKYSINDHDGVQTHNDGSPFFGIHLFNNKKKFEAKQRELKADGYTHRQQGPDKSIHTPQQLTRLYELSKDTTGKTLKQYERFVEIHLHGYVPPHYTEALDKADNAAEFVRMVHRFESKSGKSTTSTLDMLKSETAKAEELNKGTVKQHTRRMASGKVVEVKEHEHNGHRGFNHPDFAGKQDSKHHDKRRAHHHKLSQEHWDKAEEAKTVKESLHHTASFAWHETQSDAHADVSNRAPAEYRKMTSDHAKLTHADHLARVTKDTNAAVSAAKKVKNKWHQVGAHKGYHHPDTQESASKLKGKKLGDYHNKQADNHHKQKDAMSSHVAMVEGVQGYEKHAKKLGAAAEWHECQRDAHRAAAHRAENPDNTNHSAVKMEERKAKTSLASHHKEVSSWYGKSTLGMLKRATRKAEEMNKSTVKGHKRRMKSGKVVDVKEHMINGIKGYQHPDIQKMPGHLKKDERAGFHEKMRDVHGKHYAEQLTAGVKAEVDGKKTDASHEHEAAADWHMRQHMAHHSQAKVENGKGKENYFAAGAKISHAGHMKRNKANASSEKSLDDFPLIKSVMSKGLTFKKSGKELKERIKLKLETLHLQLAEETGRFQEEVRQARKAPLPAISEDEGMAPRTAEVTAPIPDYPAESWKMRSLQREIGQCYLIENNIVDSHSYDLSEYDLKTYGF